MPSIVPAALCTHLRPAFSLFLFLGVTFLSGCGANDVVPVGGTVSLNGRPLDSGLVVFTPVGQGRSATATIQSDGSYSLVTDGNDAGALVGEYRVAVIPAGYASAEGQEPVVKKKNPIPTRYLAPDTSGLRFTVEKNKSNRYDIRLLSRSVKS